MIAIEYERFLTHDPGFSVDYQRIPTRDDEYSLEDDGQQGRFTAAN